MRQVNQLAAAVEYGQQAPLLGWLGLGPAGHVLADINGRERGAARAGEPIRHLLSGLDLRPQQGLDLRRKLGQVRPLGGRVDGTIRGRLGCSGDVEVQAARNAAGLDRGSRDVPGNQVGRCHWAYFLRHEPSSRRA
ncbi:hypothetical protein C791_8239 [Amycolatopsis azurea DSM 43854]|uniref:Uncharacterized protein n=1 Tax=Amycolatopsis azurea DSM 43854 TaxID=1238180 RepID=M2NKJ8_9PSEU|nr:hypothetical protein C791_8239 [Amycolatopsis azurea DSM 43854]